MKQILILLAFVLLNSCTSEETPDPLAGLPPETQIGANTFGCLIDGQLFLPRSGPPSYVNPVSVAGLILWGGYSNDIHYFELEATDHKGGKNYNVHLHLHDIITQGEGSYTFDASNGYTNIDGNDNHYIQCLIFDKNTNSYKLYVSSENSGTFEITKLRLGGGNQGTIFSGTFYCVLKNIQDPRETIEITNGRFDINSLTVMDTYFP